MSLPQAPIDRQGATVQTSAVQKRIAGLAVVAVLVAGIFTWYTSGPMPAAEEIRAQRKAARVSSGGPHGTAATARPASAARPSKAPWAERRRKLDRLEFAWLVENARNAPTEGSYILASRALSTCLAVVWNSSEERQLRAIDDKLLLSEETRHLQREATHKLWEACRPLGAQEKMNKEMFSLLHEARPAGDALSLLLQESQALANKKVPADVRATMVKKLLDLDDPEAAYAVRGAFQVSGAVLDGQPVPKNELGMYASAWDLAICSTYGACGGIDSLVSLKDCWRHSECGYLEVWEAQHRYLPPWTREGIQRYFLRVRANLDSRHFERFGVHN